METFFQIAIILVLIWLIIWSDPELVKQYNEWKNDPNK